PRRAHHRPSRRPAPADPLWRLPTGRSRRPRLRGPAAAGRSARPRLVKAAPVLADAAPERDAFFGGAPLRLVVSARPRRSAPAPGRRLLRAALHLLARARGTDPRHDRAGHPRRRARAGWP